MDGKRLRELRLKKKLTQEELGKIIHVTKVSISGYESGDRTPDTENLSKLADYFDVSTDYLLGRPDKKESDWNTNLPELTAKDERDIAKDLEDMLNNLSQDGYAAFDGRSMEDMDEEDVELLKASLENSLRMAKRMAKQKFTPNKYRD